MDETPCHHGGEMKLTGAELPAWFGSERCRSMADGSTIRVGLIEEPTDPEP
jgi:hypothetical protein